MVTSEPPQEKVLGFPPLGEFRMVAELRARARRRADNACTGVVSLLFRVITEMVVTNR